MDVYSAHRVLRNLTNGRLYAATWLPGGGLAHLVEVLPGWEAAALSVGLPVGTDSRATATRLGWMPAECWDDVTDRLAEEIVTICQGTSYLTTAQCAALYGGDRRTWKRWVRSGRVGAARFGRLWLVPWGEFDKIRSGTLPPGHFEHGRNNATEKTRAAGVALVRAGQSVEAVARVMGVCPRTVHRWIKEARPASTGDHPPPPTL